MRCALYIRVSTEEQHLNGLSLPAQRLALTDYANKNNYTITECYADEGISARKSMTKRKELLRLLDDVKANKIDMILVTKLDRWFRNIKDYNITEEILSKHNCDWKTIFENYDSSTANGQMVINIMLSVNQAECDRTSERIKAVFDYKRAQGNVTSGMAAPYGYMVVDGKVVKDKKVSPIVKDIIDQYFLCYSKRKTVEYILDKYGKEAPSMYKIDKVFTNEKYAGKFKEDVDFCEPYMSFSDFNKIKEISDSKTYQYSYEPFIFSSMIICPYCNHKLSGYTKKQTLKNGSVSIYKRYKCSQKYIRYHASPNIAETVIEQYLIDNIEKKIEMYTMDHLKISNININKKKITLNIQNELERLNFMFQKGHLAEAYYESEYQRLTTELNAPSVAEKAIDRKEYMRFKDSFARGFTNIYSELDAEHKNSFWKKYVKEIYIDKETHKICGFKLNL
ncbi:MAG: recombinase family protein [Lachnospiraceae bacterium]